MSAPLHPALVALLDHLATDASRASTSAAPLGLLRRLIATVPAAALVADDAGRYVLANTRASELTGYTGAELRRLSVWQLTPTPDEHDAETLWRAFLQRGNQHGDYQVLRKSGRIVSAAYAARANVLPHLHVSLLRRYRASSR
ncbi:MAG TPA: PAS domain S-box protein [Gemmatimonadaceae bacterium]|nr:PAS domain S-box protein [Gemmatimonadaceae bacterium]